MPTQVMTLRGFGGVSTVLSSTAVESAISDAKTSQAFEEKVEKSGKGTVVGELVLGGDTDGGTGVTFQVPKHFFDRHRMKLAVGVALGAGLLGGFLLGRR